MYAAHFAASLGCKAAAPRVPVVALLMAGMVPDLAFALLMRRGVERIEAPIGAPYAEWQILAPYSHGALLTGGVTLLVIFGVWLAVRQVHAGAWIAALAGALLLHLVCDWCVDPGGILIFADGPATSGLGLWRSSPQLAMLLEIGVVGVGAGLFLRTAKTMSWPLRLSTLALLGLLTWESTVGQRTAVLPMRSPELAIPYLWQIARDLLLVSIVATLGTATMPSARAARAPMRDM
ncbi:MAG: hypothetical protein K2R93_19370 [Gemmatimonadaceae bacterium]|nr:hypothetical protein [Gemmatimonadaceae bacterium]